MTEERMQSKYARLLREGKTSEATKIAQEMSDVTTTVETEEIKQERFAELNGVGDELADEMVQVFGSYDRFVEGADVESLADISGIGESRAESLLEQVDEE